MERTWTGACPRGYTDHPADPARCVLPAAAARMLARAAPERPEIRVDVEAPAAAQVDPVAALNAEMEARYQAVRQREMAREEMRRAMRDALEEEARRAQRE